MRVGPLDHYTLRVEPGALPQLRAFYVDVVGLSEGARPDFPFPGHWLYAGERAVVHLAGLGSAGASGAAERATAATGRLDHISMRASGLAATRRHLAGCGVAWDEAPVPSTTLHQVFLRDPCGLKLELTFDLAAEDGAAAP